MESNSFSEGKSINEGFADRQAERIQNEEENKLEQQKIEIQQQELALQQQQQDSNQLLIMGGLILATILVLAVAAYITVKLFKRN